MKQWNAPPALAHLEAELETLRRQGRLRERPEPAPHGTPSFCSNDYLGLASASATGTTGAGASRLLGGEREEHRRLEVRLAGWLDAGAALTFSSGYAANVGVLSALASDDDLIVSDALNHASLIDGARLSRARVAVVPHLDLGAVQAALLGRRERRAWVVTESYFSMDADSPDLRALRALCDAEGAGLVVDEAHALGVLGPEGRGLCAEAGVRADVLVGTMGKAFGAAGAFVTGAPVLIDWLWNRARSFVFSTGMSPLVAAAGLQNLERAVAEPARRARVLSAARGFRAALANAGLPLLGTGHIVPWLLGAEDRALAAAAALRERDVHVLAVRPPTVPAGSARIRFTLTAAHGEADLAQAAGAVQEVSRWLASSS